MCMKQFLINKLVAIFYWTKSIMIAIVKKYIFINETVIFYLFIWNFGIFFFSFLYFKILKINEIFINHFLCLFFFNLQYFLFGFGHFQLVWYLKDATEII